MELDCKRLPATDETLMFLSPFFAKEHIKKGIDDRLNTCYGIYRLFTGILNGQIRVYGVFDLVKPMRFFGFQFGHFVAAEEAFENHACWDRHIPTVKCVTLCKIVMKDDYARDGITIKHAISYIPDINRSAKWLALRCGCADYGIKEDRLFYKGNYVFPCRKFMVTL